MLYSSTYGVSVICISLINSSSISEPYFLDMWPWNHFGMTPSFTMWFFLYSLNQVLTVSGVTASAMTPLYNLWPNFKKQHTATK